MSKNIILNNLNKKKIFDFRIFVIAHKAAKKSGKKKESKVIEYKQEDVNNVQVETFLHENELSENCFREISRKP